MNIRNIFKHIKDFLFAKDSTNLSENDLKYVDDLNSAILLKTPSNSRRVLYLIASLIIISVIWAALADLDEVTVGTGKVIPSQQIQVVQNLEGGILKKVLVREGQRVEIGEVLLEIDETQFLSDFREQAGNQSLLLAEVQRLRAELESIEVINNSETIEIRINKRPLLFEGIDASENKELLARQRELYGERLRNLSNQLDILSRQVDQRQQESAEIDSQISHLEQSYRLVRKELDLTRPLATRGVVSEVELIKLERGANEVKGDLNSARLLKPKIQAEIRETLNKRQEAALKFRNEAQENLAETESELAGLDEVLISLQDRLKRTTVKSPVKGAIKTIQINTVGGVIQPGMDLMEIVPIEDSLLVEAKILPKDIAFLRPNLEAVIKLTAYDFAIYGGLKGTVEHISADTIQDEKENSFYLIRVRTEDSYFDKNNEPLPIIPGMTASVDVITGKKSVLDYLLKPIIRAKQNALREK